MAAAQTRSESGFTLVEVMVAIAVLLVGVLGAVTMIDGASAQTARTKAREGSTALARSVLEISRGVPYADLTPARVLTELDARGAGFADSKPGTPGHQVSSRGFVYTVTPTVCSMDDPKDALGPHDETGVSFCADSDVVAGSPATVDRNPDDYRRVAVGLTWRVQSGPLDSATQTGIVTNPVGGLGPSVLALTPRNPNTALITGTDLFAEYDILTSTAAEDVALLVNGSRIGSAEGEGTDWDFSWNLGDVDAPNVYDCTYVLQAQAFDEKARAGAPRALTVTINRRQPFAPANFAGGPNQHGNDVDLQWSASPECDVGGYRVYRGPTGGAIDEVVEECEIDRRDETECVDVDAPAGDLTYEVAAIDTATDGAERTGDRRTLDVQLAANDAPPAPVPTGCWGGSFAGACNDVEDNPAPDGTAVLSWPPVEDADGILLYRIYRAGAAVESPGYEHRLNVLYPILDALDVPLARQVFIDATADGSHRYWVSAVDGRFGESEPAEVTWP